MMKNVYKRVWALVLITGCIGTALANNDTASVLREADQLIAVERLDDALNLLKELEADSPNVVARANALLGKIYLRLGKPAQAAELTDALLPMTSHHIQTGGTRRWL